MMAMTHQVIQFTKMHGLGNDFVLVDAIREPALADRNDWLHVARAMCDRREGIGADGVILMQRSTGGAPVAIRIFNADGSEAEMCGNGLRCVGKYVIERQVLENDTTQFSINTPAGLVVIAAHKCGEAVERVTVTMGRPGIEPSAIGFAEDCGEPIIDAPLRDVLGEDTAPWLQSYGLQRVTCVSMGNPHAVLFVDDVRSVVLEQIGPAIETHPQFKYGINVHVAQVNNTNEITMRTWERGCGETRACGSGAAAVCAAGVLTDRTSRNVQIHLPGGDLSLLWNEHTELIESTGPAVEVCTGEWRC